MNNIARKFISASLSALIAGGCMFSAYAGSFKFGDTDGNGTVNSSDALAVLEHSIDKTPLKGDLLKAGDVNADGVVNSSDALAILMYSVGQLEKFDAEKATPQLPATKNEILKVYADAVKKAREEKPSYTIKSVSAVKNPQASVKDPLGLLKMGGSSAAEMEEQLVDEMLQQGSSYTTIAKQKSNASFANLPCECTLTDASKLKSIDFKVLSNGNYSIEIKLNDESKPKAGSTLTKVLPVADYDTVAAEFAESAELEEGLSIKTSLDELAYKNCWIKCEINPVTGEFVTLEWNTDMYTKTSMSMIVSVTAIMTDSINTSYYNFGY